jgi:tetratricopeptide (TPR) repeat protein
VILLLFIGAVGTIAGRNILAEYHCRAARQCLAKNKLVEAQEHLDQAFQIRNDASTHLLAARLARRKHDGPSAKAHLEECDRILGGIHPDSDLERELIQAQMGDFILVERHLLQRLEENDPESAAILEAMAEGYWNYNHLAAALRCLNKWLDLQPGNIRALYMRGEVEVAMHQSKEAANDFRACLESDTCTEPTRSEVRFKLANALLDQGVPDQALPHFQALREQSPANGLLPWFIARCETALGNDDEAKGLLDALIAAHPKFAPGWRDRGKLALAEEDYDTAERYLRMAIQLARGDKDAHFNLYKCLLSQGKEMEAEAELAELQQVQRYLVRIDEIRETILPNQPRNPRLHYELGTLYLKIGLNEEGVRWLESSLLLAPKFPEAKQALAKYRESAAGK